MAKRPNRVPDSEERTNTVFYNWNGQEILRLGLTKRDSENEDGTEVTETLADWIECGDGTFVSPSLLMRPGSNMLLATCDACLAESRQRNGPRMVLSPAATMRRCSSCNARLCDRHQHLGADNRIRCDRCDRRQARGELFSRIFRFFFFERVER